jgi:hypothetical protein
MYASRCKGFRAKYARHSIASSESSTTSTLFVKGVARQTQVLCYPMSFIFLMQNSYVLILLGTSRDRVDNFVCLKTRLAIEVAFEHGTEPSIRDVGLVGVMGAYQSRHAR